MLNHVFHAFGRLFYQSSNENKNKNRNQNEDEDEQIRRAIEESIKDDDERKRMEMEKKDEEEDFQKQQDKEAEQYYEIQSVVFDKDKLTEILSKLPGVNPDDRIFDEFYDDTN